MEQLLKALIQVQKELVQPKKNKKANVGKFSYEYADLGSVLDSLKFINKYGLFIAQTLDDNALVTRVYHESGAFISSTIALAPTNDPQEFGMQMTYYRRYALCALFNIAAEDDTDNVPYSPKPTPEVKPKQQSPSTSLLAKARSKGIADGDLKDYIVETYGCGKLAELSPEQREQLSKYIDAWFDPNFDK